MKILITAGIFEPEIGGPAEYAPKLAAKLIERGHEVKVLTYSAQPAYDFDAKYSFPLERIVRTNKFSNYLRFFHAVLKNAPHYDLIYSLDWFSAGFPMALAARLARKKYLLRIGGGYIWEKYLNDGNPMMTLRDFCTQKKYRAYPAMYAIIKFVMRGAEKVIFNTEVQKDFCAPHYGVSPERLATIFNPIPKALFSLSRSEPQKEIVFAGRMTEKNNIEGCLRAFVRANLNDFILTFIGDGFLVPKMRMLAEHLGVRNVRFFPATRQKELYERIKNCWYVVLPSWTDISPNTAYECLALGIPFLITMENYLSIRDQIPIMIDPRSVEDMSEKMCLLSEKDAYTKYCAALRVIKFDHDWDDVCDEHIDIFKKYLE